MGTSSVTSLDDRIDDFRERVVGRQIREASWGDYEKWIRRFEAWYAPNKRQNEPGIGVLEDFDNFLADPSITDYPWSNSAGKPAPDEYAYRSRVNAISAVKKWIRRDYGVDIPEPPDDICLGEAESFDPTYISPDGIDEIIEGADDDCAIDGCKVALQLTYDAMLRATELTRVKREDVDLGSGTLYVRTAKRPENHVVGLDDRTIDMLSAFMAAHPNRDRLFRNSYDRAWRPSSWRSHVYRAHVTVGSHSFGRHSPIMHRLEGADPDAVDLDGSQGLGEVFQRARHKNPSTTAKYARVVGIDVPEWADNQ